MENNMEVFRKKPIITRILMENNMEVFWKKPIITLVSGNLVEQPDIDVIVNAANDELLGGGGVCGAIFKAAGWSDMQDACDAFSEFPEDILNPESRLIRCQTGGCVITPAYNLPNKAVIHAVGPIYNPNPEFQTAMKADLESAYKSALQKADEFEMTSIGFPAISTGVFKYPVEQAAEIALKTVRDYLLTTPTSLIEVRFVFLPFGDGPEIKKIFETHLAFLENI